jgi:hypothetical protein
MRRDDALLTRPSVEGLFALDNRTSEQPFRRRYSYAKLRIQPQRQYDLVFLQRETGPWLIGFAEHEDQQEAERLAYEDAVKKAQVISMKQLKWYQWWKRQR